MVKTDNNKNHSYEISPTVEISASAGEVWSFLIHVENWWVKSNPEHKWLVIHNTEKDISIGTKITVREKIAGIPCKANVWADFPKDFGYRLLWFLFKNLINGIKKDYEHAMRELVYIKKTIESNTKYQS